jgi:Fe(3+) dicitrate transport protein
VHLGYRFDGHQSLGFDLHAYALDSGLAGLMSYGQFQADPNQTTTPADHLWTDRYTGVLTYRNDFDARSSFVQRIWTGYTDLITRSDTYTTVDPPALTPDGATLAGQRSHYTGLDGRFLQRWGEGNALTLGYTAYYSTSPYDEYLSAPYVGRDDESGIPFYRSERGTRFGALFGENVFRLPHRIHVVTSARIEQEQLTAHEYLAPHPLLVDDTYRKTVPLFGLGLGNDFGRGNETYLNVSQGFRPLRYLDIASPFSNFSRGNNPDPTHYLTYEAGVHGWPLTGFYYDASLFQVNVRDRIESESITSTETIDVNTGNTRSRGVEAEAAYDLLRLASAASARDHLDVFANASLLDATFTGSIIPGQVGKTPAYAPHYVLKEGVTLRREQVYKVSLVVDSVGAQYFQDSDTPVAGTPALMPSYTVVDLAADYTLAGHLRLLAGVSNLFDRIYYSRVFLFGGSIEPAERRAFYAGAAYDF